MSRGRETLPCSAPALDALLLPVSALQRRLHPALSRQGTRPLCHPVMVGLFPHLQHASSIFPFDRTNGLFSGLSPGSLSTSAEWYMRHVVLFRGGWRPSQPSLLTPLWTHTGHRGRTLPPLPCRDGRAEPCPRPSEDPGWMGCALRCNHEASQITAAHPAALGCMQTFPFPTDSSGSPLMPKEAHTSTCWGLPDPTSLRAAQRAHCTRVCTFGSCKTRLGRPRPLRRWLSAHQPQAGATGTQVTPGRDGSSCRGVSSKRLVGAGRVGCGLLGRVGYFQGLGALEGPSSLVSKAWMQPQMQKQAVRAARQSGPSTVAGALDSSILLLAHRSLHPPCTSGAALSVPVMALLLPDGAQEARAGGRSILQSASNHCPSAETLSSGDTDRRWSRRPAGARGPGHGEAELPSLCPDLPL